MKNLTKNFIQRLLAYGGFNLVRSDWLNQLLPAQELLPDAHSPGTDYYPENKIGNAGISLNVETQLSFLRRLEQPRFQELFRVLRAKPDINVGWLGKNYRDAGLIHNGYYPTPDAELYAAFIAEYRPTSIIEIGSGYSTLIAHHTVKYLGIESNIVVVDPAPRTDVSNYASRIEYERVEKSSLSTNEFTKGQRSILFIDSSHVSKMGGDVPFLFCQLLPNLPAGVIVHVHDIFTPFDYPINYGYLFFNEQYVLQAMLANSQKFFVLFSTHLMSREHAHEMQRVFGEEVGRNPLFNGSSFWIETR